MTNTITLERIKDVIIEAYSQVDKHRQEQLLQEAYTMESRLVSAYQSKGLKVTATNIAHTLEMHRKNQFKRFY